MHTVRRAAFAALATLFLVAACGDAESAPAATGGAAPAPAAAPTPAEDANIIEIRMTNRGGGAFEPAEVTAGPGDVLRFVNVEGVHNISFPADRNPSGIDLPAASPYLTSGGQTHDVVLPEVPGEYFFQCDPHVPVGMVGSVTVQ
jgi:plastocyanin